MSQSFFELEHDLKRDIHNLFSLLKFLKREGGVLDTELAFLLEKNLEREKSVNETIGKLKIIFKENHE